jgi:2-methylcitrate dehydratase PrpD
MGKQLTDNLAQFISWICFDELPKEVVHQTKRCLLDFLGVALAGGSVGLAPLITNLICDMGGSEESTIIGDGRKIPALNAVFVNSIKGHTLDMDDGHRYANGHPGVVVIPSAIALAEKENITGKELIEAIVVGYEIFIRIAALINPSHLKRGFHTTGTVGPFGAAAACSKILNLNEREIKNALAIAGLQGAGLLEVLTSGQMMKPLHPGRASQGGLIASLLAKGGAEGPNLILEGEKGFFKAFSDVREFNRISSDLGNNFEIMNIYFKLHAACRHIHPAIDAVKEIMERNEIDIDKIKRIEVSTYSVAYNLTGRKGEEDTELGAKFNLPISIALVLVYGKAGIDEYSMEYIKKPMVQELSKKVKVIVDKERDYVYPNKRSACVKIEDSKGAYQYEVELPKGDPEVPLSDDELKDKFFHNAKKALPIGKITKIQEAISNIEEKPMRELMKLVY